MIMVNRFSVYEIDGVKYYNDVDFAIIVGKSTTAIKKLCFKGNKIRKLKCLKLHNKTYIPIEELVEYPFKRFNYGTVYFYKADGSKGREIPLDDYMAELLKIEKRENKNKEEK